MTGGREGVRTRMCNSNKTEYVNHCSLFINCNEKPKLQGTITNADARRILDIPFRSTFTDNIDLVDHEKYIFKAEKKYIDDEDFIMSLRIPYFKYLVNNYLDVVNGEGFDVAQVIPDSIKKRTLQYLTDCDFITNWFMETYEKTEDGLGLVQLKDVYDLFKLSEVYSNMSKEEKRTYTKSYFIEKIKNNIFLKSYYKDRERRKEVLDKYNKKTEMTQVLVGFKVKEEDEEDIPDECLIGDDDIQ